ncbi:hypothetical protein Oscil6304_1847 [Oscillatoria acuminata PCC 6304]|uniref:Uncharacterized protein n=2 Tax=Oscillatoria acuminata TaxID=118323 RepID=K9TG35_9CYAN|nr:hypothetical protein Oscil6304_1847 [Oscillatoria acuminata PCC 6304]
MLKHQVYNSDTLSSQLLAESQLLSLWFASGHQWSPMIQENCLKTLDCPVHLAKKSQSPSNFTLLLAWMFLLMTVAALLAPLSNNIWVQNPVSTEITLKKVH